MFRKAVIGWFLFMVLGTMTPAWAAHTYDTKANLTRGRSASGRDFTGGYTCGSGATLLTVAIAVDGLTARTGGAPTYNGVAMTQADQNRYYASSGETISELWYLPDPPTGSALTLHIPDNNNVYFTAEASSYKAASGYTTRLRTANGTSGSSTNPTGPSLTGLATGDVIVACVGNGATTWAPSGRTGTQLYDVDDGSYGDGAQYYITPSTSDVAMAWTFGTSSTWGLVEAAFQESLLHNLSTTISSTTASSAPVLTTSSTYNLATAIAAATSMAGPFPGGKYPQHYWPFNVTGNYTDQGTTGGLNLTEAGTGNTFGAGGLILNGSGWATGANNADVCNLGSTYSLLYEVTFGSTGLNYLLGLGDTYIGGTGGVFSGFDSSDRIVFYRVDTSADDIRTAVSAYPPGTYQVVLTYTGGALTLYVNGSSVTSGSFPASIGSPLSFSGSFGIGAANYNGSFPFTGTIKRVGVLKGIAWSADDVTAIYAGGGTRMPITRNLIGAIACVTVAAAAVLDLGAQVRNLVTSIAAVSATSTPIAAITRALSTAATATSQAGAAILLFIHNLISALAAVTGAAAAALPVTRNLSTSLTGQSQGSAAPLPILRKLSTASAAVTIGSTPVLTVGTLYNLTTAISAGTTGSTPALNIIRSLVSILSAVTTPGAALLGVLRKLTTAITAQGSSSTPALPITRNLASAPQAVTVGSSPPLPILRKLSTTLTATSQTSAPVLTIQGLVQLVTSIQAVTLPGSAQAVITRHLVSLLAVVSAGSTPELIIGVLRNLITSIQAITATSAQALKIGRNLATTSLVSSQAAAPVLNLLINVQTAIAVASQASEAVLSLNAQRNLITMITVVSAGPAMELKIYLFPVPSYATLKIPAENRRLKIAAEERTLSISAENRILKIGGK